MPPPQALLDAGAVPDPSVLAAAARDPQLVALLQAAMPPAAEAAMPPAVESAMMPIDGPAAMLPTLEAAMPPVDGEPAMPPAAEAAGTAK